MKVVVFGLIAAVVALASSNAAVAQRSGQEMELGSRIAKAKPADIPDNAGLSDQERGRATLFQFAECIVRSQPRKAEAYLAIKRDDPQSDATLGKLANGEDCLRAGEITIPYPLLRGAMFRSAYLDHFRAAPAKLGPQEFDFDLFVNDPKSPGMTTYRVMMDFGICVVRRDVANADKLVRANAGTPEETAAVSALTPSFGPCMIAGQQLTLNRSVINAFVSEAIYREALAAPTAGATGSN